MNPDQTKPLSNQVQGQLDDSRLHLLDLLIVLGRHKKLLTLLPLFTCAVALAAAMAMKPVFTSTAKILPPQQASSSMAALLGQMGGVAGLAGSVGLKSSRDVYIGILGSRTVADALISRFGLKQRYEANTMDDARRLLAGLTDIVDSKKEGLISVAVNDRDPKFAAQLANGYVEELVKLTQTLAVSDASQRRLFFEKQLKDAKDKLANAEVALRTTQEKTGIIQPEGQVRAVIQSVAELKGQIAAKEVQIASLRTFATAQNPEFLRAQEELRGMRVQLARLEENQPTKEGDLMIRSGRLPEAGIQYVRALRDVKYYEAMFDVLAKQYEMARLDEAKDSSMVQVLDQAVPAERKSKPKRALITLGGLVGGVVLALLTVLFKEAYRRSRRDPRDSGRWTELSTAWKR